MRAIILFGLVFFVTAESSTAQTFDKIISDVDVEQFVKKSKLADVDSSYKNFELTTGEEVLRYKKWSESQSQFSPIKTKSWQKADLNKDRKVDLIISGIRRVQKTHGVEIKYSLLVFLANKDSFTLHELLPEFKNFYPAYFNFISYQGEVLVELTRVEADYRIEYALKKDTLSIYQTSFFEKMDTKAASKPDTVHLYVSSNWGGMPRPHFMITAYGQANYQMSKGMFNGEDVNSIAYVDSIDVEDFFELINRANIQKLNSKYNLLHVFDVGTSHLVIKFKDGSEKRIDDYGHQGTFGLLSIYSWINFFITNLKWQAIVE